MQKILKYSLFLLVILFIFHNPFACFAGTESPNWLVSPELLGAGKLKMLWENKLPMKSSESLDRLFILGNRIYALSDRNYMVCLNREKGSVIFSRSFAEPGLPVVGLQLYKDELFSIIGNKLTEISLEFGTEQNVTPLHFGIACPAARNSSYFYVAAVDKRVHALRSDDKVKLFEVAAENDSPITSIIADENFVIFATDAGNVISITPDRPKRLWQFDAAGGIAKPIVRDEKAIFAASRDTNIYKLDIHTGKLLWKYQTAAMLQKGPQLTKETLYQYAHGEGMTAIEKETGKFLWQLAEGLDLLAEDKGKAYVITNNSELIVMDNKKAKQLYSINFAPVSRYASNLMDSNIYIADTTGRIACLIPAD